MPGPATRFPVAQNPIALAAGSDNASPRRAFALALLPLPGTCLVLQQHHSRRHLLPVWRRPARTSSFRSCELRSVSLGKVRLSLCALHFCGGLALSEEHEPMQKCC